MLFLRRMLEFYLTLLDVDDIRDRARQRLGRQ